MLPPQLIQSLQNVAGFNQQAFVDAHTSTQPITSIRINGEKYKIVHSTNDYDVTQLDIETATENVAWCKQGFYLNERPYFTHNPLLHCGAFYVQEASSMFLLYILQQCFGANTHKTVLDLCAAPGGKSTLLANYFNNGFIVSNEVIKQRANILVENITKWGAADVVVTNNDAAHFAALKNFFDVVVVDAPCSGSGLFRKDADAIKEWSIDNVNLCSQRQQRIVNDVMKCLNNSGIFIYSTCSYSTQENEDIVDWIIQNFDVESVRINNAESFGIVETQSNVTKSFGYRFYPNNVKGEGFFVAVFKKNNGNHFSQKIKETALPKPTKQEQEVVHHFINIENNFLFKHNENVKLFSSYWQKHLQQIAQHLYIKKAGIEIGLIKGKDVVPSHELAMSYLDLKNFNNFNINKSQALQYLSKKEVIIEDNYTGWALLQYRGYNLGFAKILKNRMNNYYPTEWRILNTNF